MFTQAQRGAATEKSLVNPAGHAEIIIPRHKYLDPFDRSSDLQETEATGNAFMPLPQAVIETSATVDPTWLIDPMWSIKIELTLDKRIDRIMPLS